MRNQNEWRRRTDSTWLDVENILPSHLKDEAERCWNGNASRTIYLYRDAPTYDTLVKYAADGRLTCDDTGRYQFDCVRR